MHMKPKITAILNHIFRLNNGNHGFLKSVQIYYQNVLDTTLEKVLTKRYQHRNIDLNRSVTMFKIVATLATTKVIAPYNAKHKHTKHNLVDRLQRLRLCRFHEQRKQGEISEIMSSLSNDCISSCCRLHPPLHRRRNQLHAHIVLLPWLALGQQRHPLDILSWPTTNNV